MWIQWVNDTVFKNQCISLELFNVICYLTNYQCNLLYNLGYITLVVWIKTDIHTNHT